jgi:hypothetical protein
MKKKAIFSILILGMAGALAALPAFADSLYTTLGPDDEYLGYFYTVGWLSQQVVADSFTLNTGGAVSGVQLALNYYSGYTIPTAGNDTPLDVYIETDNGGVPGSVVASLTQVGMVPTNTGNVLTTFTCSGAGCTLGAGSYWLVALEPDTGTLDFWYESPLLTGSRAWNETDSATGPWTDMGVGQMNAFEIDGTTSESGGPVVPEPSSFLLLGSGLACLAELIKRKLMA